MIRENALLFLVADRIVLYSILMEHISCCCWNEQDESEPDSCKCLCLLSKCEENKELKTLVDELRSKDLK